MPDVVLRRLEQAAARRREVELPGERRLREGHRVDGLDRHAASGEVERVGPLPADVGRAGHLAPRLARLDAVEPHALALEAQRRGRRLERLVVGDALVDLHAPEAKRRLVLAVQVELARDLPFNRVVVEQERVAQVGQRPVGQPHARVDLLAAVAARVAERKASFGFDHRLAAR